MRKILSIFLFALLSCSIALAQFNRTYYDANYNLQSYAVMYNDNTGELFTASRMAVPIVNTNFGILLLNTDNMGNINHEYYLDDVSISSAHLSKTANNDVILAYLGTSNAGGNYRAGLHIICFASDFSAINWDFFTTASTNGFEKADIAVGTNPFTGDEEYYFGYSAPNSNGTDNSPGIVKIDVNGTVIFNNLYESNPRPGNVHSLRDDLSALTLYTENNRTRIAVAGVRREDFDRDIFTFSIQPDGAIADNYRYYRAVTPGYNLGAWVPDMTWDGRNIALTFGSQFPSISGGAGSFTLMRLSPSLNYVDGLLYSYGTSENLSNCITYSPNDKMYRISAYMSHATGGTFTNIWYMRQSDLSVTSLHLFNPFGTDKPMTYGSHTTDLNDENYLIATKEHNNGTQGLRVIRTDVSGGDKVCGNLLPREIKTGKIDYVDQYENYVQLPQPFPSSYGPVFNQAAISFDDCDPDNINQYEYKGALGTGQPTATVQQAPVLYPNKVSGNETINLSFPAQLTGDVTISITNSIGQLVHQQVKTLNGNVIMTNAASLSLGLNIVTASLNGNKYIFKVLKY